MMTMDARLTEAYEDCGRIVRHRAKNFWFGLRLTPEPRRSSLYAIYAWMRLVDDLADEPSVAVDSRRSGLVAFRSRTRAAFGGEVGGPETIWRAFTDTVERYELSIEPFEAMIDGQESDLDWTRCPDRATLERFCWQAASTVGLICVRIWGHDGDPEIERMAADRGKALQLTNILRDLREDYERQRVYLPADELEAEGLSIEELLAWREPARCRRFLEAQIEHAAAFYRRSSGLEKHISSECRATSWAMTEIYRGLLDRIARDPRRVVKERVRLGSMRKMSIAWRAKRLVRSGAS
ncbi:MAG: phytoene/squalene synthase family protein [Planctomycetota bacterium]|nr:phytoene/squalene synthase family protein [Planctomycetota bacterium]